MYICVIHFYDLSALVGCWSSVSIRRIINNFYMCVLLTVVTQTDRPKSVRNRCAIEVSGDVFYVVTMLFWIFLWV